MENEEKEPMLPGFQEWFDEMDAKKLAEEERKAAEWAKKQEEEEQKRLKYERDERIWKEKEYRMYASSSAEYKFGISGPNAYVEETQDRLALILSRYFRATNPALSSYEVALHFFKNYKTSWIRWNKMPTQIHLKDVWMETPFNLKSMPTNSVDFAKLAKKVIPLIFRVDERKFAMYVNKVEEIYRSNKMSEYQIEMFQKTPHSDLIKKRDDLGQEHETIYQDYDQDYGYNDWATVAKLQKINDEITKIEGRIEINKHLYRIKDMVKYKLRKDFTKEEYYAYQKERRSKKFINPLDSYGRPIDENMVDENNTPKTKGDDGRSK